MLRDRCHCVSPLEPFASVPLPFLQAYLEPESSVPEYDDMRCSWKWPRPRKAFTLVELLIVVIIIAVLAAIAIPKFADSSLRSKEAALRGELKLVRDGIELFKNDCGCYPAQLSDLTASTGPTTGKDATGAIFTIAAASYKGPYISSVDPDPVDGTQLGYSVTSPNVGKVTANPGASTDGSDYSSW
jgi:prepilin-type N-terminal cleavage/methylation domain-containing protein